MEEAMEIMLRCALRDRPGTLARLAGAIGQAGGDIQAIEIVDREGEEALDDLVIAVGPTGLQAVIDAVTALEGVRVVHAGPSRGDPGDAVIRLAIGVEAFLTGTMDAERALTTLVGGTLHAASAALRPHGDAPPAGARTLVLPVDDRSLVLSRDYDFTDVERERAEAVLRAFRAATPPQ